MESVIDSALGVAKESIKTFTQEAFNNTIKLINGFSAILLTLIPGKTVLEGIQGWELHPTFRAPRIPRWMENGVSSFNEFIHDYTVETDSESESEYESGLDDDSAPPSPSSQSSHLSRSSSMSRRHSRSPSVLRRIIRFVAWPLLGWRSRDAGRRRLISHSRSGSAGSLTSLYSLASRRLNSMRDFVMWHQTTDSRRRGVIEDLQLLMELSIEKVFEVMHNVLFYIISPIETMKTILRNIFYQDEQENTNVEQKAVLGDSDPSPTWRETGAKQRLNTDSRTCGDIITDLGYPYEALRVTTEDGYVLLLERIPRRDSQKVVYLQHGLFDSSLGWVSNGVVGSQAFAAYDQGYDVFLGNFRGLVSREHVNKNISSERYWRYSVNEHGTQDIPAMLNKIHELKMAELQDIGDSPSPLRDEVPYTLCGICHSLGGAAMLIHVVTARLEGRPHRLSRLILLSPAGFHEDAPGLCYILQYVFPLLAPIFRPLMPGFYIPTKFLRMVFNKLARDFQNYPALGGLVQILCGYVVGGDSSNWVGALGTPHYNMDDMPGVSYMIAEHLSQMMRSKRFIMYDFGSVSANMEAYGTPEPLDIAAYYNVIDIPVDLVAGKKDKLIPKTMVRKHYEALKAAGCEATYQEFEYAHLDFTFSLREELLAYVMSRLLLVTPPERKNDSGSKNNKDNGNDRKSSKSKSFRKSDSKKLNAKPLKPANVKVSSDGEVVTKENVPDSEQFMNGPMFAFSARDIASAFANQQQQEQQDGDSKAQVFASAKDCLEGLSEEQLGELSQMSELG